MEYIEFFKLCGFSDEDIAREGPRIDKAFEKAAITQEDINRGVWRIKEYYAYELEGVRKILGVWMKEFLALMLCREENRLVIYSEWPGPGNTVLMAAIRTVDDVYCGTPVSQVLHTVFGCIFDILHRTQEVGEENGIGPGAAHCPLWQSHVGAIHMGLIPKPDLMLSCGWYCDIPAETDQLLAEVYDIPTIYLDGCIDWQWDTWPELGKRQVNYSTGEMLKVKKAVEEVIGCEITGEAETQGFADQSTLFFNFQTLTELFGKADPQPIGTANLGLFFNLFYTPTRYRSEANQAILLLSKDVMKLVKEGKGVVPKGAPRVYVFARCFVDPSISHMMERAGLNLCSCFMEWIMPGTIESITGESNAELAIEGTYKLGAIVEGAEWFAKYVQKYCETFQVDGAIMNYLISCRPVCTAPLITKKLLQEESGIPTLALEFESYDTRQYSAGQLRTRVESFAEMLRQRKSVSVS